MQKTSKHIIAGVILVSTISGLIYAYYRHNQIFPNTDNAYVNAKLINISPKISGYIKNIYVNNNQFVHNGESLLELDPVDYNLQLAKAKQDLLYAKKGAITAQKQITNAQANINRAKSDYNFANKMAIRYTNLFNINAGSRQDMEKYTNDSNQANQAVNQATAALEQAKAQYEAANIQIGTAQIALDNAKNNVLHTILYAPADGYVTNLNLQNGELVGAGQKLFGLVDNSSWWLDVNLKETQLKRIRPGQKATITLDMYNHTYTGVVQSISFASGNTFSLLPSENATGNWVKVTQRFTVRVKVDNDPQFPLRVGASANVMINTK